MILNSWCRGLNIDYDQRSKKEQRKQRVKKYVYFL